MSLTNFVDKVTVVTPDFLNKVDVLKEVMFSGVNFLTGVTGGNTILGTFTFPATPGQVTSFVPVATNSGPTTVNGVPVNKLSGGACVGGEFVINVPALIALDAAGTTFHRISTLDTLVSYRRSTAEISNSLVPRSYIYPPGDSRRHADQEFSASVVINRDTARFGAHNFSGLRNFIAALEPQVDGAMAQVRVHCYGSSVGLLTMSNGLTVGQHFFNQLKRVFDYQNVRNFTFYQGCVNGHSLSDLVIDDPTNDITDAITADGGNPQLAIIMMGMNDQQISLYNSGATYPFVYTNLRAAIARLHNLGCSVIVCTSVHTDTDHLTYLLDPLLNQIYPTAIAAPVSAAAMIPPASASVINYAFGGSVINIDYRAKRVNEGMRRAAIDTGACVCDVELYHFKAIATYGVTNYANIATSIYGNPSQLVHPAPFGMDVTYGIAVNDFCNSLAYSGGADHSGAQNFTRLGLNFEGAPTATIHIQQESASLPTQQWRDTAGALRAEVNTSGLLKLYNAAGTQVTTFDPNASSGIRNQETRTAQGSSFLDFVGGFPNVSGNQDVLMPNDSAGTLEMIANQGGIGRQHSMHRWRATAGTLTVDGAVFNDGAVVINAFAGSGLNFRMTCAAANTFIAYRVVSLAL